MERRALIAALLVANILGFSQPAFAGVKTTLQKCGLVAFSASTFLPRWGCYLAVVPLVFVLERTDRFIEKHMTRIERAEEKEKLKGITEDKQS